MISRRLFARAVDLSIFAMGLFFYLFISRNAPGLTHTAFVTTLGVVYGLGYIFIARRLVMVLRQPRESSPEDASTWPVRILLALALCLLIFVFLDSTVTDYYQPLSLFDEAIAALAAWWGLLLFSAIGLLPTREPGVRPVLFAALLLALWTLAAWPLAGALQWINQPQSGNAVALSRDVFTGGEDGYNIYRIPGLTLISAGSTLASGQRLEEDRLLAFAEARQDGALDTGVIDLVVKTSDDGGVSWGGQAVICQYKKAGKRGKCGNPTPLFDSESGTLFLAYNLSGIETDPRHHSGHIMQSPDGGLSWGEPQLLSSDNFVFGPGKGLQKSRQPHPGRLLLPGHADNHANIIYSDDHGLSWQRGTGLAGGNESDVAELSDGRLYFASRHNAPISRAPEPNGRQFSLSADGGETWLEKNIDTSLATPVCQASVLATENGSGLLFSNPAHERARVNMSLRFSDDGGKTWPVTLPVYPGPSGYSVLAQLSNGDVVVLYENGNMAYSERISLALIRGNQIRPADRR